MQELLGFDAATFRFLRKFLQCEPRSLGIAWDESGQEKSPRALIL